MDTRQVRTIGVLAPSEDTIPKTMGDTERIMRRAHNTSCPATGRFSDSQPGRLPQPHEIGIPKAMGATRRNVLRVFLIEAVVLSLVAGILGALFGVAGPSGGTTRPGRRAPLRVTLRQRASPG